MIPKMKSPRRGILVQKRVDGWTYDELLELSPKAAKAAQSQMESTVRKANYTLGARLQTSYTVSGYDPNLIAANMGNPFNLSGFAAKYPDMSMDLVMGR